MADQKKQQLNDADVEAIKARPDQSTAGTGDRAVADDDAPSPVAPSTRRGLLGWIAPVILSLGTALKAGTAQAGTTDDFVDPLPSGRCLPTPAAAATPQPVPPATAVKTAEASRPSTAAPKPTLEPATDGGEPAAQADPGKAEGSKLT